MNLDMLLAKDAIREAIYRYCRVLDRMDKPEAYALWNKGATAHYHGIYEGSGAGFVDWVWESHARMERHSHQVTNVIIEVDGNTAVSESYVTVVLWMPVDADDEVLEIVSRGRYLDNWSLQADSNGRVRWGLDRRENVTDLQTVTPVARSDVAEASRRDRSDPLYALFNDA